MIIDYEKLHKDTIAKLQQMVNSGKITVETAYSICADFVPESEDEKIKYEIIGFVVQSIHRGGGTPISEEQENKWIAWLEKQAEPKPAVDTKVIIPKFRVGDIVKSKSQPMLRPRKIISIGKDCYWCEDRGCIGFAWEDNYEIVEQKSDNWIQELEDKLANATPKQLAEWKEKYFKEEPAEWSEDDGNHFKSILSTIECCKAQFPNSPAVVESYNADAEWLKSLKGRVWLKQEWSEENKNRFNNLIFLVECSDENEPTKKGFIDFINRLKSLRSQNRWRPSDRDIKLLRELSDGKICPDNYRTRLYEIINNLKYL